MTALQPIGGGAVPFSNGTEFAEWSAKWCDSCTHDHAVHLDGAGGCDLVLAAFVDQDRLPEGWLPPPEGYGVHLPLHMVCARYLPCTEGGCEGDPYPDIRVAITNQVRAAWGQQP